MKKSIKSLAVLDEFDVQELSLKTMEEINGGDDPWYDLGYYVGKAGYKGAKNIYNGFAQMYNAYFP
jgi:hypothetical protein